MDLTNKDLKEVVQLLGDRKALKFTSHSCKSYMSDFDAVIPTYCFNIYYMVYDSYLVRVHSMIS